MTREDAINMLHGMKADNLNLDDLYTRDKYEALNMAIKALELEPCEDCISRQAVDRLAMRYLREPTDKHVAFYEEFIELPPVPPKPKTDVLEKIRAEIEQYEADCRLQGGTDECKKCNSNVFGSIYRIIDKYTAEKE